MAIGELVSVNEAARMLRLTDGRIRQLLLSGELRGEKINARAWAILRNEVERFAKATRKELPESA